MKLPSKTGVSSAAQIHSVEINAAMSAPTYRYVEPRGDLSVNVERAEMVHGVRTFGNW